MQISEILHKHSGEVFYIAPEQSIAECVEELNRRHIGALCVIDAQGVLRGIVSERDVLRKAYDPQDKNVPCNRPVREIMRPRDDMPVATPNSHLREVLELMRAKRTRHVVIVDEADKALNVISVRDIIEVLLAAAEAENRELQNYMFGY